MTRPKFPNLDRFMHQCINNTRDTISVRREEARGAANEYAHLLEYITQLQDAVIVLQTNSQVITKIDYDAGNFNN